MTITAKRLERLGVCQRQIDTFRALWGEGPAPMTVEAATDNAALFDWNRAALFFLEDPGWRQFRRVRYREKSNLKHANDMERAKYQAIMAKAQFDKDQMREMALLKKCRAVTQIKEAEAEYQRVLKKAQEDFDAMKQRANADWSPFSGDQQEKYHRALAKAFAEAYIAQQTA
jgi:hypothetical protein